MIAKHTRPISGVPNTWNAGRNEMKVIDTPASDSYLMRLAHSLADTLVSPLNDSFVERAAELRHQNLEKRFMSLARTFEETVNRLTDNQQIIGGIKAFLRLIQQDSVAAGGAAPRTG